MKKIRLRSKRFGVLALTFFVVSCATEDPFKRAEYRQMEIKQLPIALKTLKSAPELQSVLSQLNLEGDSNKIVYDSINDFSIDDERGVYFELGTYHSYTFHISRVDAPTLPLENLVISKTESGYELFIYTYDITAQELKKIDDKEIIDLTGKISKKSIRTNDFIQNIVGKYHFNSMCWEDNQVYVAEVQCNGDGHTWAEGLNGLCALWGTINGPLPGYSTTVSSLVPCDSGGGGSNPGGPSPPSPGQGPGGSVPGTVVITAPTPSCTGERNCPPIFDDNPTPPDCNVTTSQIGQLFPNLDNDKRQLLTTWINNHAHQFGINTKDKLCHFLAQVAGEIGSNNTLSVTEGMHYTTQNALLNSYGRRFSASNAPTIASMLNNPQGLANFVYCCDNGNNTEVGAGWKYRGGGLLQLTWKNNYLAYKSFLADIGLHWSYTGPHSVRENPQHSILSGLWYFQMRVLPRFPNMDINTNVDDVTRRINPYATEARRNKARNKFNEAQLVINCQ